MKEVIVQSMQVSGYTVTGKGMLVNIGGKLLAAEQRDGGRTICAVFGDNHIITVALWSHACEDIIGRLGENLLFTNAWLTQWESRKGASVQPGGEICELELDSSIDVDDSADAAWISQERLTLPTDQLRSVEDALEASNESVLYCKVSYDGELSVLQAKLEAWS